MNGREVATVDRPAIDSAIMEQVMVNGDLSNLTTEQRLSYYDSLCTSLGLNPLSKPFSYIKLNGKLTLYALKDCTDQLRTIHGVSIVSTDDKLIGDIYRVTVTARTREGRTDVSTGAVSVAGLRGEALANAYMKSETKAKRRVTLSICGLGMLDESEVASIPNAVVIETPTTSDSTRTRVVTTQIDTRGDETPNGDSQGVTRTIDTTTGEITEHVAPNPEKIRARFWERVTGSDELVTAKQLETLMAAIYRKTDSDELAVPAIRYLHQHPTMEMEEMTRKVHSRLDEMTKHPEFVSMIRALYSAGVDFVAAHKATEAEPVTDAEPTDEPPF